MELDQLLQARGGVRHYWVEPDAADRYRPERYRIWPWKEMKVDDYLLIAWDTGHLFGPARSAASRYGGRNGKMFRSWQSAAGLVIYRDE